MRLANLRLAIIDLAHAEGWLVLASLEAAPVRRLDELLGGDE